MVEIEPEVALRLFEDGATIIFLDVPVTTEIGIDFQSWNTAEKFKGIKMIPPGVHYIYYRLEHHLEGQHFCKINNPSCKMQQCRQQGAPDSTKDWVFPLFPQKGGPRQTVAR